MKKRLRKKMFKKYESHLTLDERLEKKSLVNAIATAMQRPDIICMLPNFDYLNSKKIDQLKQMLADELEAKKNY